MPSSLQTLELVDDRFGALMLGEKKFTIRLNEGKIKKGLLLYRSTSGKYCALVLVTKVHRLPLGRVLSVVGADKRHRNNSALLRIMRRHYPEIALDTMVDLAEHLTPNETGERIGNKMFKKHLAAYLPAYVAKTARYNRKLAMDRSMAYVPRPIDKHVSQTLLKKYGLQEILAKNGDELKKIAALLRWVKSRWVHNGFGHPSKHDALTILHEAKRGKQFCCAAYATLAFEVLNAMGFPARKINLRTSDVATRQYAAAHVAVEVYLPQFGCWMLADGQTGYYFTDGKLPLNAAEVAQRLSDGRKVVIVGATANQQKCYLSWAGPCFYYLVSPAGKEIKVRGHKQRQQLLLAPIGAPFPKAFQIFHPKFYSKATRSYATFYQPPILPTA